ncbi:hypothetical protein SUDANB176_00162 [Streptomyces sp. enrichment culture]
MGGRSAPQPGPRLRDPLPPLEVHDSSHDDQSHGPRTQPLIHPERKKRPPLGMSTGIGLPATPEGRRHSVLTVEEGTICGLLADVPINAGPAKARTAAVTVVVGLAHDFRDADVEVTGDPSRKPWLCTGQVTPEAGRRGHFARHLHLTAVQVLPRRFVLAFCRCSPSGRDWTAGRRGRRRRSGARVRRWSPRRCPGRSRPRRRLRPGPAAADAPMSPQPTTAGAARRPFSTDRSARAAHATEPFSNLTLMRGGGRGRPGRSL